MKKIVLVAISLLGFTTINAQDQLIKISPFHFFDGTFNMSIEKSIKSDYTINLTGGVHLVEDGWNYDNQKGATAEIQIRKYLINWDEKDMSGIYVAPYGKLAYFRYHDEYAYYTWDYDDMGNIISEDWWNETRDASVKQYNVGILIGTQYIISDVISLDMFFGGGIQYADVSGSPDYFDGFPLGRFYTGIIPKIGFNFGVKF